MKTKKYEIYQCWKDKAITKNFEVKRWELCEEEDEAVKIKGTDLEELFTHSESINMDLDTIEAMRKKLRERCVLHGAAVSMSSKMLSAIDILLEGMENK